MEFAPRLWKSNFSGRASRKKSRSRPFSKYRVGQKRTREYFLEPKTVPKHFGTVFGFIRFLTSGQKSSAYSYSGFKKALKDFYYPPDSEHYCHSDNSPDHMFLSCGFCLFISGLGQKLNDSPDEVKKGNADKHTEKRSPTSVKSPDPGKHRNSDYSPDHQLATVSPLFFVPRGHYELYYSPGEYDDGDGDKNRNELINRSFRVR